MGKSEKEILQDILDRIPDTYDKREGSVLYEAIAPTAFELAETYFYIDNMRAEQFLGTATGVYLDLLADTFDFVREKSVPATVKAEIVGADIFPGYRFSSIGKDAIIYVVKASLGNNFYEMQAEVISLKANYYVGNIVPITAINNLSSAKIVEVTVPQKETETDNEFRKRVQDNLIAEATDGNVQQYKKWLSEIDGVGKNKIYPLWNGANTVKCLILNELDKPASTELIQKVQNILDPEISGKGNGKAPIGAFVTVATGSQMTIDIDTVIVYRAGSSSAPTLKKEIEVFLASISLDRSVVSYLQLASVITNNQDVDYIDFLQINKSANDVPVPEDQVPVLGVLNVN